jgi:hypothetical protein
VQGWLWSTTTHNIQTQHGRRESVPAEIFYLGVYFPWARKHALNFKGIWIMPFNHLHSILRVLHSLILLESRNEAWGSFFFKYKTLTWTASNSQPTLVQFAVSKNDIISKVQFELPDGAKPQAGLVMHRSLKRTKIKQERIDSIKN